jgi:hypothetical protein
MQTLTSREYKLMLKPDRFKGSDEKLLEAAALWGDLAGIIEPNVIAVSGTDDVPHRRRRVRFLDTADHWLRANDYKDGQSGLRCLYGHTGASRWLDRS